MFGDMIRDARVDAGLSQDELGRRMGVTGQAVGQWENGVTLPKGFHVQQLVLELGLDPMTLLASIPPRAERKAK